ncbi:Uncharacterized protein Fot_20829 [Forsythia ovata]|uniref:Uncharacterized protein n=1 Tax=Forsythia ovata TaxID=205694 RepID=A0ABD1UUY5_9LAMI
MELIGHERIICNGLDDMSTWVENNFSSGEAFHGRNSDTQASSYRSKWWAWRCSPLGGQILVFCYGRDIWTPYSNILLSVSGQLGSRGCRDNDMILREDGSPCVGFRTGSM